jgi:hypothetical protein
MKTIPLFALIAMLTACGQPAPSDTVASLVAHPDRLHDIERKCANSDPNVTAKECQIASEARRQIFMGNGPKYMPPKASPKF